jgi:hypothetical protein
METLKSGTRPPTPLVLFIGPTKRLKRTYGIKKEITASEGYFSPTFTVPHPTPSNDRLLIHFHETSTMMPRAPPAVAPSLVLW